MLKSRFIKPLAFVAMLSLLPVLAQSQGGVAAVPAPPGPYTALPDFTQMRTTPRAAATPASQVWSAPRGQALPYWMRPPTGPTTAPLMQNAAPADTPVPAPQYSPLGRAAAPATRNTQPNGAAFGMGQNGGFFPGFGQPNAGFFQGGQGYGNQGYAGYPTQMPNWGGPNAPFYPGFRPAYPAYGQFNR